MEDDDEELTRWNDDFPGDHLDPEDLDPPDGEQRLIIRQEIEHGFDNEPF